MKQIFALHQESALAWDRERRYFTDEAIRREWAAAERTPALVIEVDWAARKVLAVGRFIHCAIPDAELHDMIAAGIAGITEEPWAPALQKLHHLAARDLLPVIVQTLRVLFIIDPWLDRKGEDKSMEFSQRLRDGWNAALDKIKEWRGRPESQSESPASAPTQTPYDRDYAYAQQVYASLRMMHTTEDQFQSAHAELVAKLAAGRPDLKDPEAYAESVTSKAFRNQKGPEEAYHPILSPIYQIDREHAQAMAALARGEDPRAVVEALTADRIARLGTDHPDAASPHSTQQIVERAQAVEALARGEDPQTVVEALTADRIVRLGADHPDAALPHSAQQIVDRAADFIADHSLVDQHWLHAQEALARGETPEALRAPLARERNIALGLPSDSTASDAYADALVRKVAAHPDRLPPTEYYVEQAKAALPPRTDDDHAPHRSAVFHPNDTVRRQIQPERNGDLGLHPSVAFREPFPDVVARAQDALNTEYMARARAADAHPADPPESLPPAPTPAEQHWAYAQEALKKGQDPAAIRAHLADEFRTLTQTPPGDPVADQYAQSILSLAQKTVPAAPAAPGQDLSASADRTTLAPSSAAPDRTNPATTFER